MTAAAAAVPNQRDEEAALARRIVQGDTLAFELLMRRHNRRLYRFARGILGSDADAEDALQEAYLSAYRSMEKFRGESTLFTWLSRMVLNECLGRARTQARRQGIMPMVEAAPDLEIDAMADHDRDPSYRAVARAEVLALLERKVDALPEAFRTVFVLRAVEEMTVEEVAQCLGVPEATVRSRHFRAKNLLREALEREADLAQRELFEFGGSHCDRIVERVLARIELGG